MHKTVIKFFCQSCLIQFFHFFKDKEQEVLKKMKTRNNGLNKQISTANACARKISAKYYLFM